jgi:hypothetical protein
MQPTTTGNTMKMKIAIVALLSLIPEGTAAVTRAAAGRRRLAG